MMAATLKSEKTSLSREMGFGRHLLRAALGLVFVAVTVVLVRQGISVKTTSQWLIYLALFVATDQIANAVLSRIARQEDHGTDSSPGGSGSRLGH
jgi:hypothetical protein